jgi:hypothetical protein
VAPVPVEVGDRPGCCWMQAASTGAVCVFWCSVLYVVYGAQYTVLCVLMTDRLLLALAGGSHGCLGDCKCLLVH